MSIPVSWSPVPCGDQDGAALPLLQVSQLSVAVPGRGRRPPLLLTEADFTLAAGETLAVVGPSGGGKSTLLKAILGLLPFTTGTMRYRGELITRPLDAAHRRLRRAAQPVFQNPLAALNPYATLREAIAEPLLACGIKATQRRERALTLAASMGLNEKVLSRRPHQVSLGQCQRACIARACITDPELLLLDEPLSALDAVVQRQVAQLLITLRQRSRASMILVSHDLRIVRYLADRVALIDAGRVLELAPVARFFAAPQHPQAQALVASEARRAALRTLANQERPDQWLSTRTVEAGI